MVNGTPDCPPPRWMHSFCMRHQVTWYASLALIAQLPYAAPSHFCMTVATDPSGENSSWPQYELLSLTMAHEAPPSRDEYT
jgi:hypothetical protein